MIAASVSYNLSGMNLNGFRVVADGSAFLAVGDGVYSLCAHRSAPDGLIASEKRTGFWVAVS